MYRLHEGSKRHAGPNNGLSVTWYSRIIMIKRNAMMRDGQRKIAVRVVDALDIVRLWTDSRGDGRGSISMAS
jgi:hypothetical protein